jgi:FKBP-type peptidyl-prolyl cis-trans isomerase
MKRTVLIVGILFSLHLFAQKPQAKTGNNPLTVKLASSADTMQYTLGAFVAQWINNNGFLINNPALFLKGMDDMFQNKPRLIPDSTIGPRIAVYQQATQKGRAVKQEQQLFASLKDKPGIGVLPNGVHYLILKTGKGAHPEEKDSIVINFIARLADGTVVEDTYQAKKPLVTMLANLFPGLSDPLQMMTEGSKWQLFIPAALAYGEKATTLIPPNSALVIETELVAVRTPKK